MAPTPNRLCGADVGPAPVTTPAQDRRAALTCARHAADTADLGTLLAMLGLTPARCRGGAL